MPLPRCVVKGKYRNETATGILQIYYPTGRSPGRANKRTHLQALEYRHPEETQAPEEKKADHNSRFLAPLPRSYPPNRITLKLHRCPAMTLPKRHPVKPPHGTRLVAGSLQPPVLSLPPLARTRNHCFVPLARPISGITYTSPTQVTSGWLLRRLSVGRLRRGRRPARRETSCPWSRRLRFPHSSGSDC